LSLGANFGGIGTLTGSNSGIIAAGLGKNTISTSYHRFGFNYFFRVGFHL
jgi:Na+/H+ antiporter NhaD/arsenite permease-like protein